MNARNGSLQCGLTQNVGIELAGFRKLDNPLCDYCVKNITMGKPNGCASHFECDAR